MNGETSAVSLAVVAIVGLIIKYVITPLFKLLKEQTRATKAVADGLTKVVKEISKGNRESAQRNGHLGKLILEQGKQTKIIADKAVKEIISQNVKQQNVENQTIKNQTR